LGLRVIRYPNPQFEIAFTIEYELESIVGEMRAQQTQLEVHRSHHSARKSTSCGFNEQCSERLDLQMVLPLDW
jgi:hypothetical protein